LEESDKGGGDVQLLFVWLISISYFWVGANENVEVSQNQESKSVTVIYLLDSQLSVLVVKNEWPHWMMCLKTKQLTYLCHLFRQEAPGCSVQHSNRNAMTCLVSSIESKYLRHRKQTGVLFCIAQIWCFIFSRYILYM